MTCAETENGPLQSSQATTSNERNQGNSTNNGHTGSEAHMPVVPRDVRPVSRSVVPCSLCNLNPCHPDHIECLRKDLSLAIEERDGFESEARQNSHDLETKNSQIKKLRDQKENILDAYKHEQAKNKSVNDELKHFKQKLCEQTAELHKVRSQLQKVIRTGDPSGSLLNSAKTSDASITGKWKQYMYNVRNLAYFLARLDSGHMLIEKTKFLLAHVRTQDPEMLGDRDYRDMLYQSYIHDCILFSIFAGEEGIQGGTPGRYFRRMRFELNGKLLLRIN